MSAPEYTILYGFILSSSGRLGAQHEKWGNSASKKLVTEGRGGSTDFHVLWEILENVCCHVEARSNQNIEHILQFLEMKEFRTPNNSAPGEEELTL